MRRKADVPSRITFYLIKLEILIQYRTSCIHGQMGDDMCEIVVDDAWKINNVGHVVASVGWPSEI